MARNTSISLGNHFVEFVDTQVASGRYGSASDVVRAGLRMLESHESQVRALQEALKAGEDSGAAVPFDAACRASTTLAGARQLSWPVDAR